MTFLFEWILLLITAINLLLLGMSRIKSLIRMVAIQGIALGFFSLAIHPNDLTWRDVLLPALLIAMKGGVFPILLLWTVRRVKTATEISPLVSPVRSIFFGIFAIGLSLWIASRLPLTAMAPVVSISFFTIFTGLFLLVSRRKAVTQVIGYLALENGIYLLGYSLVGEVPLIVEFGVLLDVFVAVFIMGIAVYRISREFDHIDVDRLNLLKG